MNWISVKEKLPAEKTNVLIAIDSPTEEKCVVTTGYITSESRWTKEVGGGVWWNFDDGDGDTSIETKNYEPKEFGGGLLQEITHWMPLPELPEGE